MDYSGLVTAIREGDERATGKLCDEATPILKRYLLKKCNATPFDADDAIQKMYEYIIVKIRDDEIENPQGLLAYMLKTCRHNYIKMIRESSFEYIDNLSEEPSNTADQLWKLINEEKQEILKFCMRKLRKNYWVFMNYMFSYPGATSEDIAEKFNITRNNAWIRKHRVINKLTDCVITKF